MAIVFNLKVLLLIVGIIIGCFTTILLFIQKNNKQANAYLAALLLISVAALLHNFLLETGLYNNNPNLYFLPVILSLGVGPLLYIYVNKLLQINKISAAVVCLHLLPMFFQFLVYLYCFLQTSDDKYFLYINFYNPYLQPIQNIAVYCSIGVYLYLAFKEIKTYNTQIDGFYSNTHKITLQWLHTLLYVFLFYYALSILFLVINNLFKIEINYFPSDFIRCIIIFISAGFAIKQFSMAQVQQNLQQLAPFTVPHLAENINTILVDEQIIKAEQLINAQPQTEAQETPPTKDFNLDILEKIITLLQNEKLYLNEELTIADVANALGYSTKTISSTINNGLQKSFSLFVNEYRVNLFNTLKNTDKYANHSIMGLAYDCGFNSKTTFNRTYKLITGKLPSQPK